MLMYWKPCAASPLDTIASAAARTFASSTEPPQTFHEFQPSGGVSASGCSPPTIVSVPRRRCPAPRATVIVDVRAACARDRAGDDAGLRDRASAPPAGRAP